MALACRRLRTRLSPLDCVPRSTRSTLVRPSSSRWLPCSLSWLRSSSRVSNPNGMQSHQRERAPAPCRSQHDSSPPKPRPSRWQGARDPTIEGACVCLMETPPSPRRLDALALPCGVDCGVMDKLWSAEALVQRLTDEIETRQL